MPFCTNPFAVSFASALHARSASLFAMPAQIDHLMLELQEGPLGQHTPCTSVEECMTARAIAVVHVELMLIHPFR
jgi:cell filamentation protein